jgi:hypothetical protein
MRYPLTILSILFFTLSLSAQTQTDVKTPIELGGLILDAETLKPIEGAIIVNEKGSEVAYTNSSGYFRAELPREAAEEVRFSFTVKKDGYESFTQKEHWGVMAEVSAAFFIGLKGKKSDTEEFSEMSANMSDLSFGTVMDAYNNIKPDIDFEKNIASVRKGNENVFFEIDGAFYIVNDWGWIKLKTKADKIIINKDKVVLASELNPILKRKNVTGMSPIVSDVAAFEIKTNK